jgi:hypothetical protein
MMELTRRSFSRGLGGLLGGAVMPGRSNVIEALPNEPGFDDAYERLLSEYIRVEEAAIAAGRTGSSQLGAVTWEGRQLEGFIAELDGRIDIKTTARQIFAEFKDRFRAEAEKFREQVSEKFESTVNETLAEPGSSADGLAGDAISSVKGDAGVEWPTQSVTIAKDPDSVQPVAE